ncbi:ADP-ribosylation factor-like protein 2 [Saguinus oedipus]|uniref:ADP-ribosylation factor-like protein 2 n=1 Tax=Saguinus oedipus TaxID=9490 RepID=A0ABQ9UT21_SAGOE|nr:ADP-ribosylation factor-like protein 2 [Saguinus oedipus]
MSLRLRMCGPECPVRPVCLLSPVRRLHLFPAALGLDNAGKTTILKKFNGEDIDTISPTLGFNIKTLEHRGFKLNIWDVGGQKSLRSYWRNYFESTDGLIWVVDSADRQRMQDCHRELQSLLLEERLAGATLLIFANKQDLPGALSSNAIREGQYWRGTGQRVQVPLGADKLSQGPAGLPGWDDVERGLEGGAELPGLGREGAEGRRGLQSLAITTSAFVLQALELDSIRSHHWCIQGCSAVTGENLLQGIDWLLDDISSRIFTAE